MLYTVTDGDDVVAMAKTFARVVRAVDAAGSGSTELPVMALAGVCSHPSRRGEGLGKGVVERCFTRVDRGDFGVSLFQTGLPAFYEKLGCRLVDNAFVSSDRP